MSDGGQLCDCGHPVTFHHRDGGSGCGWCPPHSRFLCGCPAATTTGIPREERYRKDLLVGIDYKPAPIDQRRLRLMSNQEIRELCEVVLQNGGASIYAATSDEWHALARQLAFLAAKLAGESMLPVSP